MKRFATGRFGFACISNIITLIISITFFRPFWEETDDVFISMIAEGAYGSREAHIIYPNYIYGKVLCFLQSALPTIRWNALLQYLFLLIALTIFVYVLARDKKGRFLSVAILLAAFYEIYVSMQYSKTSAVIAIASYLVLFAVSEDTVDWVVKRRLTVGAWICVFFSIILRQESFLLATLIAGLYGIVKVVSELIRGSLRKKIMSYCTVFIPVFVMFAVAFIADKAAYSSLEWANFRAYDESRVQLIDFHHNALLYQDHEEELKTLGLTENDAFMLITWQFGDEKFVTPELMNRISSIDQRKIDMELFKAWIADIYSDITMSNPVIVGLIFLTGMCMAFSIKDGMRVYLMGGYAIQALLCSTVLFYYEYSCRWSHRVVYALLVCELILLSFVIEDVTEDKPDTEVLRGAGICFYLLMTATAIYQKLGNEFDYREYLRSAGKYNELIGYMQERKDTLFVADTFTIQDYAKYEVFVPSQFGQFDNLVCVGAWTTNSPIERAVAKRFGYTDPFDALARGEENVLLVDDNYPEKKARYLGEHSGDSEFVTEQVDTVGNINMYRIKRK